MTVQEELELCIEKINLESLWQGFAEKTLPKEASAIQRRECERAFKSGIFAAITTMEMLSTSIKNELIIVKILSRMKVDFEIFIGTLRTQGREGNQ